MMRTTEPLTRLSVYGVVRLRLAVTRPYDGVGVGPCRLE